MTYQHPPHLSDPCDYPTSSQDIPALVTTRPSKQALPSPATTRAIT